MRSTPDGLRKKVLQAGWRLTLTCLCVLVLQACIPLEATQTLVAPTLMKHPTASPQITVTARSQIITPAGTLHFAGYDWQVRSGTGGPGPNIWDPANAWVDDQGALHLKISHVGSEWHSVELNSTPRLGFGTYSFDVSGAIDQFDPNVVLGLYTHPTADVGQDGTNEIDIETARWGAAKNPNGNYTVWPAQTGLKQAFKTYEFKLTGPQSNHQFIWTSQSISFQSANGLAIDHNAPYARWEDRPADYSRAIPNGPFR